MGPNSDGSAAKRKAGPPRDRERVRRRREEILAAAGRMFAEQGYDATDVGVLADGLGVAKGTIYRYFPSKKRLFLAAVDRGMRGLKEQIERDTEGARSPLERIALAIRSYLAYFDRNPWLVELLIQERAVFKDRKKPTYFEYYEANIGRWRNVFRSLIREGRVRAIPVGRITDVISDLLYGTIFTNHFARRSKSFEAQACDIVDVFFHGILRRPES